MKPLKELNPIISRNASPSKKIIFNDIFIAAKNSNNFTEVNMVQSNSSITGYEIKIKSKNKSGNGNKLDKFIIGINNSELNGEHIYLRNVANDLSDSVSDVKDFIEKTGA